MKKIILSIVLLSSSHYATADITLILKDQASKQGKHLITYRIKDDQLKFTVSGQNRINLFNQKKQQFISFDPDSGKSSMFNESILDQRVSQLNAQRLKKLAQVEKQLADKLQTMKSEERKVGESLINLLKYPEMYGEYTQLKIKKPAKQKEINAINCQVYQLYQDSLLLMDFCLADASSLKMTTEEYRTLRSFYAFNYSMQSRLMLAMGNTRFRLIDYDQQKMPGVVIESINYQDKKISEHLLLKSVDTQDLSPSEFRLEPR